MFNPSFTNLLVQARVEQLHQAARNNGRGRSIATRVARSVGRTFDAARSAAGDAVAIRGVEFAGHGSTTAWSPRS
jgi:hypothetical protein